MLTLLLCVTISASLLSSYSIALNGSCLKTKQNDNGFRHREPQKNADGGVGGWVGSQALRQTGRAMERQTDSKNKTLKENQSSTPSWTFLHYWLIWQPIGVQGRSTSCVCVCGGGQPPFGVSMCSTRQAVFTSMLLGHWWHLCIPTHAEQHILVCTSCRYQVGYTCLWTGVWG